MNQPDSERPITAKEVRDGTQQLLGHIGDRYDELAAALVRPMADELKALLERGPRQ